MAEIFTCGDKNEDFPKDALIAKKRRNPYSLFSISGIRCIAALKGEKWGFEKRTKTKRKMLGEVLEVLNTLRGPFS